MVYNRFMIIDLAQLKAFIENQGWSAFGIASISAVKEALKKHEGIFEEWLAKEFDAEMDYLEAMKKDRYHPEKKFSDLCSVLVLQAWYGSPESGNVARYARGKDYHKVLKKKLLILADWLKKQGEGIQTYISVDSGPTVDRVLGEVAGLGFFGKNSNLIDPFKGSYFFIAILMTNAKLPVTEKRRMPGCGNCTKCAVACPTKAIVKPGVIDARRCIAYLTIENKGEIPVALRSKIGKRLFGCDVCQEVCPFNEGRAGKQVIKMDELQAVNGVGGGLDLTEVLSIRTDEEFKRRFAGTPLMRSKRRGLLRNACVVAGNSRDKSLLPVLRQLIKKEKNEIIRKHAQWAIDQLTTVI